MKLELAEASEEREIWNPISGYPIRSFATFLTRRNSDSGVIWKSNMGITPFIKEDRDILERARSEWIGENLKWERI